MTNTYSYLSTLTDTNSLPADGIISRCIMCQIHSCCSWNASPYTREGGCIPRATGMSTSWSRLRVVYSASLSLEQFFSKITNFFVDSKELDNNFILIYFIFLFTIYLNLDFHDILKLILKRKKKDLDHNFSFVISFLFAPT